MTGLNSLYNLRSRFIAIGLTGRLGSGCTTVPPDKRQSAIDTVSKQTAVTADLVVEEL